MFLYWSCFLHRVKPLAIAFPSVIAFALLAWLLPVSLSAQTTPPINFITPITTVAQYAYIVDVETGAVLLDHRADEKMSPASMSKIMTAYVAFRALQNGLLQLDDQVLISLKANNMGGSKMFVEVGKYVSVVDLLKGIIVQSGNDASVALAEFISGSEENFAVLMNDTAKSIGMNNSNFVNASGWPDDNHYTTAKDLAILTQRMIEEFPQEYAWFSQKSFTFNNITQENRNGLIGENGFDGVKTGYTQASGYGQVSSAMINNRRLIAVINGLDSARQRQTEASRLMNWGFRSTEVVKLYQVDEIVAEIPLWYGQENTVKLKIEQDVVLTKMRDPQQALKPTVTYEGPLHAPVKAGQKLAELHIHTDKEIIAVYPLVSARDIDRKGFFDRFAANVNYLLWGERP